MTQSAAVVPRDRGVYDMCGSGVKWLSGRVHVGVAEQVQGWHRSGEGCRGSGDVVAHQKQ